MGNWMSDWEDQEDEREEALRKAREEAEQRKAKEEADRKAKEAERRAKIEEHTREHFHWEGGAYNLKTGKKEPEQLAFNLNELYL